MTEINVEYRGDLRCEAVHGPSGTMLITDAPKDNHGRGESFSPSDLLAAALGSCILSVMAIVAQTHKIDISGAKATVEKEMASVPVRKIQGMVVKIHLPCRLGNEDRQRLENAAYTCPVHRSMRPDVKISIEFAWG